MVPHPPTSRQRALLLAVFLFGLALSLVMVFRSQVRGDQLNLLARGWLLVERGEFTHFGVTTSADGKNPGSLTTLLMAAPLAVWRDYRAPALLTWLSHLAAFLLLDGVVRRAASARGRLLFALFYWLNPWRLGSSAFVWNPNLMFLCGALHLWTAFHLRRQARFLTTLLHVLVLAAALQIHAAGVILVLASLLLLWRGYFKVSWPAVATGVGVAVLSLIPWAEAVAANPALLPGGRGFPLRGLLLVFPLLRVPLVWLRYLSLSLPGELTTFDFSALIGADRVLGPALTAVMLVLGPVSMAFSLPANLRLLRRPRVLLGRLREDAGARAWLGGAAAWLGFALLLSAALSPTTTMSWQGYAVLHAAVIVLVLHLEAVLRLRRPRWVRVVIPLWAAAMVLFVVAMAFGAPLYRRGGRDAHALVVHADHPMFDDLGILTHTGVTVNPDRDWMPDMFHADPAQAR